MFDSLCGVEDSVVVDPEGVTEREPTPAVVCLGIGFRKESRKAGVPNVSDRAMQRTFLHGYG